MFIEPPPLLMSKRINFDTEIRPPVPYYHVEGCIESINGMLNDENFEKRYIPKFKWFKDCVQAQNILNIGCGARETFALLWQFGATNAIGIDKDDEKIIHANKVVNTIRSLIQRHISELVADLEIIINTTVPYLLTNGRIIFNIHDTLISFYKEYLASLHIWREECLPQYFIDLKLPEFHKVNISNALDLQGKFDLIYARCVLYIMEKNNEDVRSALRNLAGVLIPDIGRLVIVEPELNEGKKYDFSDLFFSAGLKLVMELSNDTELGGNEINDAMGENTSRLKGNILYKPS